MSSKYKLVLKFLFYSDCGVKYIFSYNHQLEAVAEVFDFKVKNSKLIQICGKKQNLPNEKNVLIPVNNSERMLYKANNVCCCDAAACLARLGLKMATVFECLQKECCITVEKINSYRIGYRIYYCKYENCLTFYRITENIKTSLIIV